MAVKVLVLGATGMLGHTLLRYLHQDSSYEAWGTTRSDGIPEGLRADFAGRILRGLDVLHEDALPRALAHIRPDVVVNCVGIVKQRSDADDALVAIPVNAWLPHRIAQLCNLVGARFVQISTDCVFAGTRGMYVEADSPDATDLYGRSKHLGEVLAPNCVTIRTSIIGPELRGNRGLLNWFLSQSGAVKGYSRAYFSGVPTVELARILGEYVLNNPALEGLFHVSAERISKLDLLKLIAADYKFDIDINEDGHVELDRSLDSSLFQGKTGYRPPAWPELVTRMRTFTG